MSSLRLFLFFFYTDGGGFFDSEIDEKAPGQKHPHQLLISRKKINSNRSRWWWWCATAAQTFLFSSSSLKNKKNSKCSSSLFCFPSKFNTTRNLKPTDVSFFQGSSCPSTMGWGWGVAGDLKREINKKEKKNSHLIYQNLKIWRMRERKRLEGRIRVIDTRFSESTYT